MYPRLTKKRLAALSALLLLLLTAGAVALFTASGSGSGPATVGTSSAITLHASTGAASLYPGTSVTVNFTADNPSSGHQQVGTVHLSGIKACTGASSVWVPGSGCSNGGTEVSTCEDFDNGSGADANVSDFYMADVIENQDLPSGNGTALSHSGTLQMNNLPTSQDQCKSANLYLQFTS